LPSPVGPPLEQPPPRGKRRSASLTAATLLWLASASTPSGFLVPLPSQSQYLRPAEGRLIRSSFERIRRLRCKPQLRVVAEPPTRSRPPDVEAEARTENSEWAECLLQFADAASPADASEVWVFRKKDYQEFQRLIGLRLSYRRPSRDTEPGPQKFGEARREEAMAGTTVTCRERNVDPSLVCAECIKVFTGGAYRDAGIAVPAFPPAPDVMQCLALSVGEVFKANGEDPNDSKSVIEGPRVGHGQSPLRQAAFCNYVNARFSTVPSES
ncbi:unnamed protein product, partial [Polarella glacialis]